jgi:type II secretory pathway pseudopilin PulG
MVYSTPKHEGFTLIETLIYIGLFGLVMSAIILATFQLVSSADKIQAKVQAQSDVQFVMAKIDSALNGATGVTSPAGNTLVLTYPSGPSATFVLSGETMTLDRGAGPIKLNGGFAKLTTPLSGNVFEISTIGASGKQIKISFRVDSPYYADSFTVTRVLR